MPNRGITLNNITMTAIIIIIHHFINYQCTSIIPAAVWSKLFYKKGVNIGLKDSIHQLIPQFCH